MSYIIDATKPYGTELFPLPTLLARAIVRGLVAMHCYRYDYVRVVDVR